MKARPRAKKPAARRAPVKKPPKKVLTKRKPVQRKSAAKPINTPALPARFRPGDRVRVIAIYPPGHIRTPHYIRGKLGAIERLCGAFGNPEELAFGRSGTPRQPLYRVRFAQHEVWPDYQGPTADTVDIEIYQHWLRPA